MTSGLRRGFSLVRLVLVVAVLAGVIVVAGVLPRLRSGRKLRQDTALLAVPVVSVIKLKRSPPVREVVLPATVRGYLDAPIFARTNGYLKRWYFDIGARVKSGQLLAVIETPEADQQLFQARADLATANANLDLSRITARRYADLLKTDSVAKQDADNAAGDLAAKSALVRSAEANLRRLAELQSFTKVYAPFDGVITARNTDVGALIDSGSAGGARTELFHIAQPEKLRVYVNVPEIYASIAAPDVPVELVVAEFPDRRFQGKLVRTASAIDQVTRTLLIEIAVDNASRTLLPGAYAEAHFKLSNPTQPFLVPVSALLFRAEGLRVAMVSHENKVVLAPIEIGRDLGTEVEVVRGLTGGEAVIDSPPDSLLAGQDVRVSAPAQARSAPPR